MSTFDPIPTSVNASQETAVTLPSYLQQVSDQFTANTSRHQLVVISEDGCYRHLRCRQPGTSMWGWDVITWPGWLAVTGDVGSWLFTRETDMLRDFFTGPVNPTYWLEKCVSWDRNSHRGGQLSHAVIRQHLDDHNITVDSDDADTLEQLDGTNATSEALTILTRYYPDAWDWTLTVPDWSAVRALHAIAWTRRTYLTQTTGQLPTS